MVPIVTRPVMEHILRLLKSYGITDVIATLHYRAEEVEGYFEDGGQEERVYVLAPGSYRYLTAAAQSADQPVVVCTYDLRAWRVVVEQALG